MSLLISLIASGGIRDHTQSTLAAYSGLNLRTSIAASPEQRASRQVETGRDNYRAIALAQVAGSQSWVGKEPIAIALRTFGIPPSEGRVQEVSLNYPRPDQAVIVLNQTRLADESIARVRYRLEFLRTDQPAQANQQWKVIWAGFQVKEKVPDMSAN